MEFFGRSDFQPHTQRSGRIPLVNAVVLSNVDFWGALKLEFPYDSDVFLLYIAGSESGGSSSGIGSCHSGTKTLLKINDLEELNIENYLFLINVGMSR